MTAADVAATGDRPWIRATAATLVLWLATILVVVVATAVMPANEPVPVLPAQDFAGAAPPPVDATGGELVRTGLVRFDALWYLAIAGDGYPTTASVPQAAAFLPGYPLVVAPIAWLLGGRLAVAAQLVAFAATVAAVAGLQQLAAAISRGQRRPTEDLPTGTLVATMAFPTAFFLVAPYAESLLLAASVWSLVHAVRGRPWTSAALAAAATIIRPVGALIALPLLAGVLTTRARPDQWWRDPGERARAVRDNLVPTLGVGVGLVLLAVHGWWNWDDPLAVVSAQSGWQRQLTLPLVTLFHGARFGLRTLIDGSAPYHLLDLLVLALTTLGVVGLARRREWPLVLHAGVSALLWLSQPFDGRPLMSTPRFALALPGVMLGLALLASESRLGRAIVPISAGLLVLHLALFTRWWFVF